jgi:hypothetical protein
MPNKDQVNQPAATDDREKEGPYRRVRLNAWLGVALFRMRTQNSDQLNGKIIKRCNAIERKRRGYRLEHVHRVMLGQADGLGPLTPVFVRPSFSRSNSIGVAWHPRTHGTLSCRFCQDRIRDHFRTPLCAPWPDRSPRRGLRQDRRDRPGPRERCALRSSTLWRRRRVGRESQL